MLKKKTGGLGQGQIIGNSLELAVEFFLLDADSFEEKRLASHAYGEIC